MKDHYRVVPIVVMHSWACIQFFGYLPSRDHACFTTGHAFSPYFKRLLNLCGNGLLKYCSIGRDAVHAYTNEMLHVSRIYVSIPMHCIIWVCASFIPHDTHNWGYIYMNCSEQACVRWILKHFCSVSRGHTRLQY